MCDTAADVKTVLIVEDDADLRRMFRTALALAGYEVFEAGDGLDALRVLDTTPPDAVILDLGLPFVSGAAVRQEIAAQAQTRRVPVIVVTGLPGAHDDLDAACVLRKPVSPDRLIQVVKTCIAAGERGSALA
jgi:two-component system chemotaxis response regulator CheY